MSGAPETPAALPAESVRADSVRPGPARAAAHPLASRDFRRLWLGQAVSQVGDGLTQLALFVVVNRLTGSAAAIGTLAVLTSFPQLLLGFHAGVLADRWPRRRLLVASDLLRAVLVLACAFTLERSRLGWLYALSVAQAAVGVVFEPARAAFVPQLVEGEGLLAANALSQSTRAIAGVAGALLAGVLLERPGGAPAAFALDALTFLVAAAAVATIRAGSRVAEPSRAPVHAALLEGLRFLFAHRALVGLLASFAVTLVGIGAVNVLFVPYLMNELHAGPAALGVVRAAQVAGMVASGAAIGVLARRAQPARLLVAGLAALGGCLALLAAVPTVTLVALPLLGIGACSMLLQAGAGTLLQRLTPDPLRGRVESTLDTLLTVSLMGSMAVSGGVADAFGSRPVFVAAGALCVVAAVAAGRMIGSGPASEIHP